MKYIQLIQERLPLLKPWVSLIFVTIIALGLFTINLSRPPLIDYDESSYAEVVSETIKSGNLLTFRFAQEPWFDKPPFYFWAAMATEKILHPLSTIGAASGTIHPTEFAMRLPSALSGVTSIILVWLIVFLRTKNKKLALVASLILLTTGVFIDNVRQVRLDAPVTAAILFAYYSYLRAKEDHQWTIGIWTGISVGIMVKSVIGLLAVPIILIDIISDHQRLIGAAKHFFKGYYARIGLLISVILMVPWHLYQTVLFGGRFWDNYLLVHVIKRFDSNLFPTHTSFIQFLGLFVGGAMPWSIVFMIFLALCFIPGFFVERMRYRFFLSSSLSALVIFLLFSLSQTKAPSYLMPMYPFMAIAISLGMEAIRHHYFKERHAEHTATLLTVTASVVIVMIAIIASVSIGFRRFEPLQAASIYAEEEETIGSKIKSGSSEPVYYTTEDKWETVRFYSGGMRIGMFDRENASSTEDYYVVTPRTMLAPTLNSPAIRFSGDFTVEYMGKMLTLIRVDNKLNRIESTTGIAQKAL